MAIDLRDSTLSLLDFLPESVAGDPEVIAISLAIDPELRSVGAAIIEATILPRIDSVPEEILNELAWAFNLNNVQVWDDATVDGKRAMLVNIFAIRKKSGTRFAVRRVFDLLSVVGSIIEWWEEAGDPFTYRIRLFVDEVGLTLRQLTSLSELTQRFAPVRSFMSDLSVESDRSGPLLIYPAVTIGRHVEIPYGGA